MVHTDTVQKRTWTLQTIKSQARFRSTIKCQIFLGAGLSTHMSMIAVHSDAHILSSHSTGKILFTQCSVWAFFKYACSVWSNYIALTLLPANTVTYCGIPAVSIITKHAVLRLTLFNSNTLYQEEVSARKQFGEHQ